MKGKLMKKQNPFCDEDISGFTVIVGFLVVEQLCSSTVLLLSYYIF
jgi:hypothetical protein